jgi:hypothetical protein
MNDSKHQVFKPGFFRKLDPDPLRRQNSEVIEAKNKYVEGHGGSN